MTVLRGLVKNTEKPAVLPFHLEDPLASDLKGTLPHIQTSAAIRLYILAKASEQGQLSIAVYPMVNFWS